MHQIKETMYRVDFGEFEPEMDTYKCFDTKIFTTFEEVTERVKGYVKEEYEVMMVERIEKGGPGIQLYYKSDGWYESSLYPEELPKIGNIM